MSEAIDQFWRCSRKRLETELAGIVLDPTIENVWREHTHKLSKKLRSFVISSAKRSRLSIINKEGWKRGSIGGSRRLIDHFAQRAQVQVLIGGTEPSSNTAYLVPGFRFYPADVVPLTIEAQELGFSAVNPLIHVFTEGSVGFYLSCQSGSGTVARYSRGHNYWFEDEKGRRFEAADLIPASCAKRIDQIQPLLARTGELLTRALIHRWDTKRRAVLLNQIAQMSERQQTWNRVHLPDEQVLELLTCAEMFETEDPAAPRGLLLSGVPGTGKTLLARTLAKTSGCSFHSPTIADLKSGHMGGTGQNVRDLWEKARASQPAIIFIDECEGVFSRRGGTDTDSFGQELVQVFLSEWDGIAGQARVWVIGATNRRDLLDDAAISRFGREMQIALPTRSARGHILRQELRDSGFDGTMPLEMEDVTQGMAGRDLSQLAKLVRSIAHPNEPQDADFLKAARRLRKRTNPNIGNDFTWDNLIVDTETKALLQGTCDLLRNAEAWQGRGVSVPRGILLTGPPGVGKTQVARTIAHESGLAFIAVATADLKGKWIGHSANQVKLLFERARGNAPSIVFLDELEIVARTRGTTNDPFVEEIVGQLLQEMDGLKSFEGHVFVLAATNFPDAVDSAILSRLPQTISLPLPDQGSCAKMLEVLLREKPVGFSLEQVCSELAVVCAQKQWSGRDLRSWVERAEGKAIRRAINSGGPDHFQIKIGDFAGV